MSHTLLPTRAAHSESVGHLDKKRAVSIMDTSKTADSSIQVTIRGYVFNPKGGSHAKVGVLGGDC